MAQARQFQLAGRIVAGERSPLVAVGREPSAILRSYDTGNGKMHCGPWLSFLLDIFELNA